MAKTAFFKAILKFCTTNKIFVYDLFSTTSRKYAYANGLALLHSPKDWKGLKETLSHNVVTLSAYQDLEAETQPC